LDSCLYYLYPSVCRMQGVHIKPDSKTRPGALTLQLGYVVMSCKERTVFSIGFSATVFSAHNGVGCLVFKDILRSTLQSTRVVGVRRPWCIGL
jgi:hypothetical protein